MDIGHDEPQQIKKNKIRLRQKGSAYPEPAAAGMGSGNRMAIAPEFKSQQLCVISQTCNCLRMVPYYLLYQREGNIVYNDPEGHQTNREACREREEKKEKKAKKGMICTIYHSFTLFTMNEDYIPTATIIVFIIIIFIIHNYLFH